MEDNLLILDEYRKRKDRLSSLEGSVTEIDSEIEELNGKRDEAFRLLIMAGIQDLIDHLEPSYVIWWRKIAGTYKKREQEKQRQKEEGQAKLDKVEKEMKKQYIELAARYYCLIDHSQFTVLSSTQDRTPSSTIYMPFKEELWKLRLSFDKASNKSRDPEKDWNKDYDIFVSGDRCEMGLSEIKNNPPKSLVDVCLYEPHKSLPFDFSIAGAAARIFAIYNSSNLSIGEIAIQYFNPPKSNNSPVQKMLE